MVRTVSGLVTAFVVSSVVVSGCASTATGPVNKPSANSTTGAQDGSGFGKGGALGFGAPTQGGEGIAVQKPSTTCPGDPLGGVAYGAGEKVTAAWQISWVLRCSSTQKAYPGDGIWTVVKTERADGSPDALLAELRKADQPMPSGIACPMIAMVLPWFVLVDQSGKPHFAHIPTGQCGQPIPEAISALNALPWRTVKTERTVRVQSQLSLDTGCPDPYKDVIALTMAGPPIPPQPVPLPAPDDSTVTSKGSGAVAPPPVPQPEPARSASDANGSVGSAPAV